MAQLRDFPIVIRRVGLMRFILRVWSEVNDDNVFGWAAALAYSWLFAVFPFFIFLMTLTPYIPERYRDKAMDEINRMVSVLPKDASDMIERNLHDVLARPRAGLLSFGLLFTIWAASGGMLMTMQALDRAFDVKNKRSFFGQRGVAAGLTVFTASSILAVIVLMPIGTSVIRWIRDKNISMFDRPALVTLEVGRYALSVGLLLLVLSVIYHFGTNLKRRFFVLTPGSTFSVTVWILLGILFRFYVDHFGSYSKTYGAVGGVVILLTFFYVDALVLLIGAEIDSEVDAALAGRRNDGSTPVDADSTRAPKITKEGTHT